VSKIVKIIKNRQKSPKLPKIVKNRKKNRQKWQKISKINIYTHSSKMSKFPEIYGFSKVESSRKHLQEIQYLIDKSKKYLK